MSQSQEHVTKTIDSKKIHWIKELGAGAFGSVVKCFYGPHDTLYALKRIPLENVKLKNGSSVYNISSYVIREISLLSSLRHPNIVSLVDTIFENNEVYLVLELMKGDLGGYLDNLEEGVYLSKNEIRQMSYQFLQGLLYCHSRFIAHRDLKPQNILIADNGTVKLGDFGLAKSLLHGPNISMVVTLWYRPPELLLGETEYSTRIDIWSVACIIAEMFSKKPLFPGTSEFDQLRKIFSNLGAPTHLTWPGVTSLRLYNNAMSAWQQNPKFFQELVHVKSKLALDLLKWMLVCDPKQRPSCSEVLKHNFYLNTEIVKLPISGGEFSSNNAYKLRREILSAYYD